MIFFGAVVMNPQSVAQMLVVLNNSVLHSVPIGYSAQTEQFILSATNAGLNISESRVQGVALDSQGFPKSFDGNSYYIRRQ